MTAYMVMVRPGTADRYTDSIWLSTESAHRRADGLAEEFTRRGRAGKHEMNLTTGWGTWVSPCEIEDAALEKAKK